MLNRSPPVAVAPITRWTKYLCMCGYGNHPFSCILVVQLPRPICEAAAFVSTLRIILKRSPSASVKFLYTVADVTRQTRQGSDMRINDLDAGHGNRLEHQGRLIHGRGSILSDSRLVPLLAPRLTKCTQLPGVVEPTFYHLPSTADAPTQTQNLLD